MTSRIHHYISMSLTVAPTPYGTGHVLPFLQIAGNGGGGTRPHIRAFFAPGPNWGTSVSQITWPTPSSRGRAPDSGSGTTGHGGVPPLLQIVGHVEQRGANKKLTKVYCPPRKRSPKW